MNRREFIATSSLALLAGTYATPKIFGGSDATASRIDYVRSSVPKVKVPLIPGHSYEANVPDTLDLAERARLMIRGVLTESCDMNQDGRTYQECNLGYNPCFMYHSFHDFNGSEPKYLEALILLRSMTGDTTNQHVDEVMFTSFMKMIGEDGLTWVPVKGRAGALFDPWRSVLRKETLPPGEVNQTFSLFPHGRTMLALDTWLMRDPDDKFVRQLLDTMVKGLPTIGLQKENMLFFPYTLMFNTSQGKLAVAYGANPDPPAPISQAMKKADEQPVMKLANPIHLCDSGTVMQGLARYYRISGDKKAEEMSAKLAQFVKEFFPDQGKIHGRCGHIHAAMMAQIGMLDYAQKVGNKELMEWARLGYEDARKAGVPEVGFFCHVMQPINWEACESCSIADMVIMPIKLTEYGVGDYWEDVDRYVRNHFVEAQLTETDWLKGERPGVPTDSPLGGFTLNDPELKDLKDVPGFFVNKDVADRMLGTFGSGVNINDWTATAVSGCCPGNCARAIYFAWRAILNRDEKTTRVNLLLNRASPWADIDSHLPYKGQVDIHVKQSGKLLVRIPEYVDQKEVNVFYKTADRNAVIQRPGGVPAADRWQGRYLDCGDVEEGLKVTIQFPLRERTVTVEGPFNGFNKVKLTFRGNDVVAIDPKGKQHPLYQRERFRSGETVFKKVTRFETDQIFAV